jgi:hypothetical protein
MEFECSLKGRVGCLKLGMSRGQVRDVLGVVYKEFMKTEIAVSSTDAFDSLSFHVFYDGGFISGVEFFEGADVCFCGVRFFDRELKSILVDLKSVGVEFSEDDDGYIISDFVEIYCPDKERDGSGIESVYVHVVN